MSKTLAFAAFVAVAAIGTSTFAAEADFSGPYVGVTSGYVLGSTSIDDYSGIMFYSSASLSPAGVSIGATAGYNHQVGSLVLGVEGDYSALNAKDRIEYGAYQHESELNGYGSIRGRAGFVMDKALLFVTAGLGIIDQKTSAYAEGVDPTSRNLYEMNDNATKTGVAFGAGIEYKLSDKISAKVEYLAIKTAARNNIQDTGFNCDGPGRYCKYAVQNGLDTVRVGVNYAF